jgi:hypothetical protein
MFSFRHPVPASKFAPDQLPPEWIWPGILATGCMTLLTGEWFAGKTTLLSILLSRFGTGGTIAGRPIRPGLAVVVTDEPQSLWLERHRRLNFSDDVFFCCRPLNGRPLMDHWTWMIEDIEAQKRFPQLLVLDPLSSFLPEHAEGYAPHLLHALIPLRRLTERGMAILMNHHPSRQGVRELTGRGVGTLHQFMDIDVRLFNTPGSRSDRVRRVVSKAKPFGANFDFSIELNEECTDYIEVPPEPAANWKEGIGVAKSVLLAAGEPLTVVDIWKGWREDCPQPALKTLRRWLAMAHTDGLLARTGTGHRNDGFKYWVKGEAAGNVVY